MSQETSRAGSVLRGREAEDLYNGDLSLKKEPFSRSVRIYISSELSDTTIEKSHLRCHAYPKLRQFCQSLGLQLVIVELFQAIPSTIQSTEHNETTNDDVVYQLEERGLLEMAKDEIKLCQEISIGPTFVTLLAQRYGHKPLHKAIPEDDFKLLVAAIDENNMKQLVTQWYRLDMDAAPPQYVLQSHGGMSLPEWKEIHQSLSRTTRKAAKVALGKDITKAQYYTMSAVEGEIAHGIFNMPTDPAHSCLWFKRTFADLSEQRPTGDQALAGYTDLTEGKRGLEFDSETMKVLNHLKEARMPAKYVGLESRNIFEFSLKWQKNKGVDADSNTSHSDYLAELTEHLVTALEDMISEGHSKLLHVDTDPVAQEILCHASYCKKKSRDVMDRPVITTAVLDYLQSSSASPLVVHGVVGSGKTSLMATLAVSLRRTVKKAALVLRFIGATPHSKSVRRLLLDICKQLCVIYNQDLSSLSEDYRSLCEHMRRLLCHVTADKPLVMLLDGIDELSPDDGALGLSWLPLSLPAHVKIVLSTSSEIKYSCFPVLQSLLGDHKDSFVEIATPSASDCTQLLKHSLKSRKRALTSSQEKLVMEAFAQNGNLLYLQFILREVSGWHSYLWNSSWTPPLSLDDATELFLHEAEGKLGRVFTRMALSYITASRDGLSEAELIDILSTEEEVMQEVNQKWCLLDKPSPSDSTSPTKLTAIPSLLMSLFYHTLKPLLDYHRGTGDVMVLRWSHRHTQTVASKLYLATPFLAQARYSKLADYFSGWLYQKSAAGEDIYFEQPVMTDGDHTHYNVRKLSLLPYFLTMSGRSYELQRLLIDYEWLKASTNSMSCLDLVAEFAAVLPLVPLARSGESELSMFELVLLRDTLSLSVEALKVSPLCLSSQLLGRLMSYVRDPSPVQTPNLKRIVLRAIEDHCPKLTPLSPLFYLPGGPLLITMEGHRGLVSSLASTVVRRSSDDSLAMIVITSSWDKTLKTWDIRSTGVVKTFDGHTDKVLGVALTVNGRYALSGSADKTVRHWLVSTAECLCVLEGHTGSVSAVAITTDGLKAVSASADKTLKVWNTDTGSKTYGQVIFTIKSEQREPLLSLSLFQDLWVASLTDSGSISLANIESGEVRPIVEKGDGSQVTALATARVDWFSYLVTGTDQGQVIVRDIDSGRVCQDLQHSGGHGPVLSLSAGHKVVASFKDKSLVMWDLSTGTFLHTLTGHTGVIHSCSLADNGDLLITGADDSSVQIWDMKRSNEAITRPQHNGSVVAAVISPCGNFGLTAGEESTVIVHDLSTLRVVKVLPAHSEGVTALYALRDARHFLSAAKDGSVKLWDGESGEVLRVFEWVGEAVTCVAVTLDTKLLLAGGEGGKIAFWSVSSGDKLKTFANHDSSVVYVGFAKGVDFHYFISVARSGEVCVRNFQTAKVTFQSQLSSAEVTCAALSPNSALLAIGCANGVCSIVRLCSSERVSVLDGHKGAVTSVNMLPGNRQCLTASLDKTIRLFDITTGECIAMYCTDLPVACMSTDRLGEVVLYGTRGGWVSSAYHQAASEPSPVVKELKGVISPSLSSIQTSIESQASFSSGRDDLPTPSSTTHPLTADTHTTHPLTADTHTTHPLTDDAEQVKETDLMIEDDESLSDHFKETSTFDHESADYPIDPEVEIINGNKDQSSSSSEDVGQQVYVAEQHPREQPDTPHPQEQADVNEKISTGNGGISNYETTHDTSSTTDVNTVRSSACLLL